MDKNIERIIKVYRATDTPFFLSVVIAQYMIESNNGTSELAKQAHNYFGHKIGENWNGQIYYKDATEEQNGKMVNVGQTAWRKYSTLEECVADHLNWLTQTEWYKNYYADAINAKTYKEQAEVLEGKYATASYYAEAIIDKIEKLKLYEYDQEKGSDQVMGIKKPKRLFADYLHAGYMNPIKGVVIHNDAGSIGGTATFYKGWLRNRDKDLGIAHYYITEEEIGRYINTNEVGWHTANTEGNGHYIGYEVCQSIGASREEFLRNEDMTLRQVAEDMLFYKIPVNRNTVRLHKEFSSTTCPHRSWDLHGQSVNSVKDYWIAKIKHYQSLGKTVDEMIDAENKGVKAPVSKPQAPKSEPKPTIKKAENIFAELKEGQEVTIRKQMTHWFIPDGNGGKKPSISVAGKKDKIKKVISCDKSNSKRAYLLAGFNSWILEQDLEEAYASLTKVEGAPAKQNPTPAVAMVDGEGYVHLNGVKYKVNLTKE
ncbi:glucosaminidase domain-containing protein [Vaginisenegalia massiliensis]|uniref:glucosaminidase domain-containing protein n=1 Tax=Vaginisenegalia massiliensis TaxID=2058294 RepID=UPI000F546AED|nr:glucosaminidase domain-containing protein [Vaginisenegalia massiliensis]